MSEVSLTESKKSVLLGMALLGATNAERSAYENVTGGKQAWDELVAEGLIVKDVFYVLSPSGREAVASIHQQYQRNLK